MYLRQSRSLKTRIEPGEDNAVLGNGAVANGSLLGHRLRRPCRHARRHECACNAATWHTTMTKYEPVQGPTHNESYVRVSVCLCVGVGTFASVCLYLCLYVHVCVADVCRPQSVLGVGSSDAPIYGHTTKHSTHLSDGIVREAVVVAVLGIAPKAVTLGRLDTATWHAEVNLTRPQHRANIATALFLRGIAGDHKASCRYTWQSEKFQMGSRLCIRYTYDRCFSLSYV